MLNKSNKKGFHFIVTRPCGQATELIDALSNLIQKNTTAFSAKHSVTHIPLLAIHPLPIIKTSPTENLSSVPYSGIIFISRNAFYFARESFTKEHWKQLMSRPLFTIGSGTKQAIAQSTEAAEANIRITSPNQTNTEGLLDLPEFDDISNQNWLIVKGVGGRETLKNSLANKGANVSEAVVYQRKMPVDLDEQITEIPTQANPIWIISSKAALGNLSQSLDGCHENCLVITSSDRISKAANNLSMKVIAQANNASDDGIVKCIAGLLRERERID